MISSIASTSTTVFPAVTSRKSLAARSTSEKRGRLVDGAHKSHYYRPGSSGIVMCRRYVILEDQDVGSNGLPSSRGVLATTGADMIS